MEDALELTAGEVLQPERKETVKDYFAATAAIANVPGEELRRLLTEQLDLMSVKANHAAIKALEKLNDNGLLGEARDSRVKELMGLGMFADSVARQRRTLTQATLASGEAGKHEPSIDIPKTLDNKSWEEKYGNTFLDKVAVKKPI